MITKNKVQFINKNKFAKAILDNQLNTSVLHVAALKALLAKMTSHTL